MEKKNIFYKMKNDWLKILAYVLSAIWIVALLFPLYWLFVSSSKDPVEAIKNPPSFLPVLPKNYTLYLDTTGLENYDDDEFIYESLVISWMLSDRNLNLNLNSVTVARVENGVVTAKCKLKYRTFKAEKYNGLFYGNVNETRIKNWRDSGNEKYDRMVSFIKSDGYETGLSDTFDMSKTTEYTERIKEYISNVTDPGNKNITDNERITTVRGTFLGVSHKNDFFGIFNNYISAWKISDESEHVFGRYMLNSLFLALMAVLLQYLFSACVSYGLSFLTPKKVGRWLLLFFIITIMLPGIVEQIPLYTFLLRNHLNDTYIAILLPGATNVTYVILFKGFFDQLPRELREAAKLDGAGEYHIFFRIVIPLSLPVYGAVGIMTFLGQWNNFFWPNMILETNSKYTFPMIIQRFMNSNESSGIRNYSISLAMSVIATIPTFFMFAFMQKQMREGLVLGGLKG